MRVGAGHQAQILDVRWRLEDLKTMDALLTQVPRHEDKNFKHADCRS